MALIIEDGTGVANANSYVDLTEARSFAESRGLTLPEGDTEAETELVKGFDYINTFRTLYGGSKASCTQSGQFPRSGLYIDGCEVPANSIPFEIKQAQVYAASLTTTGEELYVNSSGKEVASERVEGAVSVSYFENGNPNAQPYFAAIEKLLDPMFKYNQPGSGSVGILLGIRV